MHHQIFLACQRVLRQAASRANDSLKIAWAERLEDRALLSAGGIDPGYGMGGNLTIDFNAVGMDDGAEGVAKFKDGKFVIAGTTRLPTAGSNTPVNQSFLAAFNANGSIDTHFGQDGRVLIPGSPISGGQLHVAAAPGRKVLLLEQLPGSQLLRRFTRTGALDSTFGNAGTVDLSADDNFNTLAAGPDGKIALLAQDTTHATPHAGPLLTDSLDVADDVIVSPVFPTDFLVTRLTSGGAVDATFGAGGSVETDFGYSDFPSAVAVQPNGKIVAAGWWTTGLNPVGNTAVVRYNMDGTLDTSFGVAGKISTGNVLIQQMALTSQGGFQVAGSSGQPITGPILTARYTSQGRLEASYGTSGETSFGSSFETSPLIDLSRDGKAVVIATSTPNLLPSLSEVLSPAISLSKSSPSEPVVGPLSQTDGNVVHFVPTIPNGVYVPFQSSLPNDITQDEEVARLGTGGRFDKTFGSAGISNIPLTEFGAPEGIVVSNRRIFVILNVNDTINSFTDSNIRIVALKA